MYKSEKPNLFIFFILVIQPAAVGRPYQPSPSPGGLLRNDMFPPSGVAGGTLPPSYGSVMASGAPSQHHTISPGSMLSGDIGGRYYTQITNAPQTSNIRPRPMSATPTMMAGEHAQLPPALADKLPPGVFALFDK